VTTTRRPMPGPHREVVALTADLVRIDSSNPTLAPHGAGESAIADYCAAWLSTRGFTTVRLESTPGRPSILATGAGRGGGRSIMLNGHLDTVSLVGYDGDPLDPDIDDGRLHGRGSYDMKAGIAAMMVAAAHGSRPDLGVDAITKAGAFLTGLDRLASDLGTRPGHPVLGAGSVHAGVIDGGQETSSYPDRCRITVERRTVPGEDTTLFEAELRAILDPITAAQPGLGAAIAMGLGRAPSTATRPRGSHPH